VGYAPESTQPVTTNSTADFGVGGFLLAGTELAKLAS
jgi:unsaturated rhamnogalacturonyl hydrolase